MTEQARLPTGSDDPTRTAEDVEYGDASKHAAKTPRATMLGRYELHERLGAGGMGEVFAAHDPELDRVVAVKVLRSSLENAERARERLRREAQVMARVSHPNVIQVFDVGVADGRVFVAMEYVEGGTLNDWIEKSPRTIDDIVRAFAQAGRGLAAAHDAGLVHRDFKPSNVLVGDDGRVLVTDFGVARPSRDPLDDGEARVLDDSRALYTITLAGGVVGTPVYMAPEQHAGGVVDGRADQFSFCVSLWRALFDMLPFEGDSIEQLARVKAGGLLVEPPPAARAKVPQHVLVALKRGLRTDPAERFATMHELLAVLANESGNRRRRRVRTAVTLGAVLSAGFVTAWLLAGRGSDGDSCAVVTDRFAGIWDAEARTAVKTAFIATGTPDAESAFRAVSRQLDARRAAWETMRRESCEATRVRKEQSDAAMDLRAACLDRRLHELGAFVAVLRRADASTITKASDAAASIGDVTVCADASTLSRRAAMPTEPSRRQLVTNIERELADVRAQVEAGGHREAEAAAQALVVRAREAAYPPVLAEALMWMSRIEEELDRKTDAERLLDEALLAAEAGGDDVLRFDLELSLSRVVGYLHARDQEGQRHSQRAQALLHRLGADPRREAMLARTQTIHEWAHGRYEQSRQRGEQAVALIERVDPHGPDMARSLFTLGVVVDELKDDEAALSLYERARALAESALGAGNPFVGRCWQALSGSMRRVGRLDEAQLAIERAIAIFETTYGSDSSMVARALNMLGTVHLVRGTLGDAEVALRKSVAILERTVGPEHSSTADALEKLASALSQTRQPGAEDMLLRAHAIYVKQHSAEHPVATYMVGKLGEHYLRSGQPAKAVGSFERAVRAIEASQSKTSPLLARHLVGMADAYVALKRPALAIPAYERALTVIGTDANDAYYRCEIEFSLAKALVGARRERERALELARGARAHFAAAGASGASDLAEVDAWLAARR
jgi:tetratricopeptide (TPR) repeat protein/predicted Ser/Thr protein kinase